MDTSSPNNLHNETINLHDIVNTVVKYWYLFAISVVCCVAIAFFYSKISKPKYVVVSNVMIRTDMSSSGNMAGAFMQQMGLGNLMGQGVSVDDELHIISSHSLFREAAVEMELNKLHIHKENFFDRWLEFDNYAVDVIDPSMQCDTLGTTLIFKVKIDEEGEEVEEDPREELVRRLLEYQAYKEITKELQKREEIRSQIYTKIPENYANYCDGKVEVKVEYEIDDLVNALKNYLLRKKDSKPLNTKVTVNEITVSSRRHDIRNILKTKRRISFFELFPIVSKDYIVATFLAVLEMAKSQELVIKQEENFGEIICEVLGDE